MNKNMSPEVKVTSKSYAKMALEIFYVHDTYVQP